MNDALYGAAIALAVILATPWFCIFTIAYWGWCGRILKRIERQFAAERDSSKEKP